jgi:hypothetical protein
VKETLKRGRKPGSLLTGPLAAGSSQPAFEHLPLFANQVVLQHLGAPFNGENE